MITELKAALSRSSATLLQDALGALSLVILLVGGLHLPTFFPLLS